jgi:hypothetical protein
MRRALLAIAVTTLAVGVLVAPASAHKLTMRDAVEKAKRVAKAWAHEELYVDHRSWSPWGWTNRNLCDRLHARRIICQARWIVEDASVYGDLSCTFGVRVHHRHGRPLRGYVAAGGCEEPI